MDKNDDFELDFDFEKEYGFSPDDIMSPEYDNDDSFNMDDIDLGPEQPKAVKDEPAPVRNDLPAEPELDEFAYTPMEDLSFLDELDEPAPEAPAQPAPQPVPQENAQYDEELTYNEFDGADEADPNAYQQQGYPVPPVPPVPPAPPAPPKKKKPAKKTGGQNRPRRVNPLKAQAAQNSLAPDGTPAPQNSFEQQRIPLQNTAPAPRRRKRSQERIIKEDYLPVGIAGVALLLCLIFIIGAVVRNIDRSNTKAENERLASEQAASEAARLDAEAADIREEAAVLAASYDYEGAIALIDSFSGDMSKYTELLSDRGKYSQLLGNVVEITDYSQLANLSFNVLIADPARAFPSQPYGNAYNQNFVTIDEFSKILQQLYDNGYVLVNWNNIVEVTTDSAGNTTYSAKPIYLPTGKKPVMITETLVNYFEYMIDGNDDGKADADGDGFASKLLVKDGKVTCEMVDNHGDTVYGAYDLVPILNEFIEANPDFSYRGAKATLAVTGKEGIFGHRVNSGDAAEVAAAKEVVQALRNDGYLIACNTYDNVKYGSIKATDIQEDLNKWQQVLGDITGGTDILVYAGGSDISDYSGPKYNVLYSSGYRFFVSSTSNGIPATEIKTNYVRQYRIMVTGSLMVNSPSSLANYFVVADVINSSRGH